MYFDSTNKAEFLYPYYDKTRIYDILWKNTEIVFTDDQDEVYKSDDETRYFLREDVQKEFDKINKALTPYALKESEKERVVILCDKNFYGNNSGIYTFIRHMVEMFDNMGYVVDLICERNPIESICDIVKSKDITVSFPKDMGYFEDLATAMRERRSTEMVQNEIFVDHVTKYMLDDYLAKYTPALVIANSLPTTKCLINIKDTLDSMGSKSVAYTHIGDVLDPNKKSVYDFADIHVQKYLEAFNNSDLKIGTQSGKMVEKIDKLLDKRVLEDIYHLPEPYFPPTHIEDYYDSQEGILMISGNYPRKNYKDMLYYIGKLGLPATLLCYNPITPELDIYKEVAKNGITDCRIIPNLYNKYVPSMIKGHRMVLHLSHIEVFPYALLEAIGHVPCVINGASEWGETFLDEAIKVDPSNEEECLAVIKDTYENYDKISRLLDYKKYEMECEEKWRSYMET